jgi:(E)-4-hydroxy-3-methylbut-2-enyl-diphosphate synthase
MLLDKFNMNDLGADYLYTGDNPISFMLPNGLKEMVNFPAWLMAEARHDRHPLFLPEQYLSSPDRHPQLNFVLLTISDLTQEMVGKLKHDPSVVLVLHTRNEHAMPELRKAFFRLMNQGLTNPCLIKREYADLTPDQVQLYAATDVGGLLIDGLGDGVLLGTEMLPEQGKREWLQTIDQLNRLSFGILQAARTRMSKTEYISCPSCGRTLFDLQETTAMIRKRTDHLKGVKIGIMGCIVNGPGEMADADYGYVGVGKDKIALYRGQTVIKKAVPADRAVDELIELIREDNRWLEPVQVERL